MTTYLDPHASSYRWATVVLRQPLRVRLDGEQGVLDADPETLVDPSLLAVGQRVWVQQYQRRAVILGASHGATYASYAQRAARRLGPFYEAYTAQRTAPLRVVWIGDSISEGWYTNVSPIERARAQGLLQDRLRLVPGGPGWRPAVMVDNALPSEGSASESLDAGGNLSPTDGFGLGRKALNISASTAWRQWTWTGDRVRIWYWRHNFLAANGTVSIDGGAAVSLTGIGTADAELAVWDSGPLTRGAHTVRVSQAGATGYLFVAEGSELFDGDFGTGARVFDASHFGWTAQSWVSPNTRWKQNLTQLQPQLVILALGTNDSITYDASTYEEHLLTGIGHLDDVLGDYSLALVTMPGRTDQPTVSPWADYRAVHESLAQAHPSGLHIDTAHWWDRSRHTDSDGVHTTQAGQRALAAAIAAELGV